jgi:hypothetical protein
MKSDFKASAEQTHGGRVDARQEAAYRLEEAKAAAKEVADLCARAVKAARKIPHAGMGTSHYPINQPESADESRCGFSTQT